jgi:iron complex outermembrane receptor protein
VQPEKVSAYEVGAKTSWLDHRLIANLAGFYTNYTNMQMQVQTDFARQYRAWINVGGARIYGFELELAARPVRHLELNASVGNTTSKVTSVQPIAQYDPVTNPTGVVALGARLLHTPLFSTDVGATVDFPAGSYGSVVTRVNWSSKSSQEGDLLNSAVARVRGYNVTNLRVSYESINDRWELYVLSDNLFDKKYEVARYSFSPSLVAGAVDGAPRTVAAGVHVRF